MRGRGVCSAGIDMRRSLQWRVEKYDSEGAVSLNSDNISRGIWHIQR